MLEEADANDDCEDPDQVKVEDENGTDRLCVRVKFPEDLEGDEEAEIVIGGGVWIPEGESLRFRTEAEQNFFLLHGCSPDILVNKAISYSKSIPFCPMAIPFPLLPQPSDSARDAYQHIDWSWRNARDCGVTLAQIYGIARESFTGNQDADMDLHNNEIGFDLFLANGGSPQNSAIQQSINSGDARVDSAPFTCFP